jgi:formylmethanofuran dehydrogenase subunit E
MIKRETPAAASNAHHRALRRCHGCGAYARPAAEPLGGRIVCEKCYDKAKGSGVRETIVIAEA